MPPRLAAYLAHAYTASGSVVLLASATVLLQPQPNLALSLALMGLAVFIDATDGILARKARVKERLPTIDGRAMDDVIDYVGYVFLPVLFLIRAGLLPEPAVLWGAPPLIASAFGFSQVIAKLDDEGFFVGFPSYWNVVAFYLYLWQSPPWLNAALLLLLSALVFVPTRYLYITRFERYKRLNYVLAYYWGVALVLALFVQGVARTFLLGSSLIFPVYYTIYSLWLDHRARHPRGSTT